jgi:Ca2+/Na+ antiporter
VAKTTIKKPIFNATVLNLTLVSLCATAP